MLRISNIFMNLNSTEEDLKNKIFKILKTNKINSISIFKKSIDARNKSNVRFVFSVDIDIDNEEKYLKWKNITSVKKYSYNIIRPINNLKNRPVVIGAGPAGLFAGLILAQAGLNPIIIERGKPVEERKKDIDEFWTTGKLLNNSNIQFGEGGAGAFSDGKLTTGITDNRIRKVLLELVESGAPSEILILAKPHIGTDNLKIVIKNLREKIISLGGEFRFETRFINFNAKNNKLYSINLQNKNKEYVLYTEYLVLSIGHSARDTFEMLYKNNINMEAKAFSMGVRIEHKQEFINKQQYGDFYNNKNLGAAEYKLNTKTSNGRGVYTFCMCPGGLVVASASEQGRLVTNGMSYYKRDSENANSALLVSVGINDFIDSTPLGGVKLQRKLEEDAFILGGESFKAPAQLVGDFLNDKVTTNFGSVIPTYKPGVTGANLKYCLPNFIYESLKEAIVKLDKIIPGFANYDSVLTGVESRSSSPIRIIRDFNFNSNILGILPCGEGAGYAGGIMSAAVDGIKCAEKIINSVGVSVE